MTLAELRTRAEYAAAQIPLDWDKLQDPFQAQLFITTIEKGTANIEFLESIYNKLTSGKSVILPDQTTKMSPDTVTECTNLLVEELFSAYLVRALHDKFKLIDSITSLA